MSRSWKYTLNNYNDEEKNLLKDVPALVHYCGMEEAPSTGTKHLEGYITFDKVKKISALKKMFERAHWEMAKGDDADNFLYNLKDKKIWINYNNKKQGKRNDLEKVYNLIKDGKSKKDILDECPVEYIKFHGGIDKAIALCQKKRDFKPVVTWLWGPTGTGKTRYVNDNENNVWYSMKNLQWWDGYENQDVVCFDDFRKDFCTFHELLRILDRYPYRVNIKGGSVEFNSKKIYITSCYHPEDMYDTREDIKQLTRRIDVIKFIGEDEASHRKKNVTEVDSDNDERYNFYL